MSKFLISTVSLDDRHTEPRYYVPSGMPLKSEVISLTVRTEVISLTVRMISSGDTRSITASKIINTVMDRLKEIEGGT